jgi:hypothetical protein
MSATAQARYERALAQRKAMNDQIMNYYKVRKAADDEAMDREYKRARIKYYQDEAARKQSESEAKVKREDDIAKAKQNALEAQQRKNDAETIKKRGENQYAVTYWQKYGEYRETMDHEEADRRANIDAAAAEQEVLNQKQQNETKKADAAVTNANKKGTGKSTKKKGKQKKATSGNTPPTRLANSQRQNQNNTRPSKRK